MLTLNVFYVLYISESSLERTQAFESQFHRVIFLSRRYPVEGYSQKVRAGLRPRRAAFRCAAQACRQGALAARGGRCLKAGRLAPFLRGSGCVKGNTFHSNKLFRDSAQIGRKILISSTESKRRDNQCLLISSYRFRTVLKSNLEILQTNVYSVLLESYALLIRWRLFSVFKVRKRKS